MSETTTVQRRERDPATLREPHRARPRAALVKLGRAARAARRAARPAAVRRGVLAAHRLRRLRRDHRRGRAQPPGRHHRAAVAGPRVLPRRRRGDLHLRLRRARRHRQRLRRAGLAAAGRHGPRRAGRRRWRAWSSARSPPGCGGSTSASPRSAWSSSATTSSTPGPRSPVASTAAWCPPFSLFGFGFGGNESPPLTVLGVPFGQAERLWYLGLVLCIGASLVRRAT